MKRQNLLFVALAIFQMAVVVVPVASAVAQGTSFAENFDGNVRPGTLEESGPLSPAYTNGTVVFTGGYDGLRTYLRTVSNYNTTNFVAEVTVTVATGFGGTGIAFVGFGAGEPNCGFYCEPMTAPNIYARIGPDDFGPFVGVTNGTQEHVGGDPPDGGDGTHRVRITWDHATGEFTFAIHRDYTGGPFVPTTIIGPVEVTDEFGDNNSRIFFGGAGNATFDNLRVLALAGTPGDASCHGESVAGLASQFKGIANAARALAFPNVAELQTVIDDFCGN
jgi:hypothetical protein